MEVNHIYQFVINQEVEVEKTWQVQEENGETVTRKKKEKVLKPYTFLMSKPKRKDINRCDEQRKISLGKYIRSHYITKAELKHQYEKFGIEKEFGEQWVNSLKLLTEVNNKLVKTKDEEEKTKLEEEQKDLLTTINNIETRYREIFDSTAETAAETDTVVCLMLFCTYLKDGDKIDVYFKGNTFEEKRDYLDKLEDDEDEVFMAAYSRILTLWTAWFYGNKDEKSLAEIDEKIVTKNKTESEGKEEKEKGGEEQKTEERQVETND